MTRSDILEILKEIKIDRGDKYGLLGLGLFGSAVGGDFQPESDVDVVVGTRTPDPFPLVHLKAKQENRLNRRVDIIRIWVGMNPILKKRIDEEAVHV
ncbi:MAG: nucleotidyltransferase family protein [Desulfococcaceae bacterium]